MIEKRVKPVPDQQLWLNGKWRWRWWCRRVHRQVWLSDCNLLKAKLVDVVHRILKHMKCKPFHLDWIILSFEVIMGKKSLKSTFQYFKKSTSIYFRKISQVEIFTNIQNWHQWQYWHQRLYCVKTKKSSNKLLPQWVLNLGSQSSGLMISSLGYQGMCYLRCS